MNSLRDREKSSSRIVALLEDSLCIPSGHKNSHATTGLENTREEVSSGRGLFLFSVDNQCMRSVDTDAHAVLASSVNFQHDFYSIALRIVVAMVR